jgi:YidC/Oxa1 family membrane protein insertase
MGQLFNALINALGAVLAFFYQFLHSFMNDGLAYGLSIILLTIFINILVFPLTLKQTRATRAFTALQPEIKRIQAQYKDDPQEMQRQLMAAQKAAGATPGGCLLPLLVQMPIWFALFRLLRDPLAHIGSNTALAEALSSGQNMSFLGMDLGTSPAMAVSESGFLGVHPAVARHLWAGERPDPAGRRGPAGGDQGDAAVHRFHIVELSRRSGPVLDHIQPLPSGPAGPHFQDRWAPTRTREQQGRGAGEEEHRQQRGCLGERLQEATAGRRGQTPSA